MILPSYPKDLVEWLKSGVSRDWSVFEYGSGNSTHWFSEQVRLVVTVEHNVDWVRNYPSNVVFIFSPPLRDIGKKCYGPEGYTTTDPSGGDFENYVKTIDSYADEYFDFVVIDGRSRASCIKHSIPKVRRGGLLLLDDSNREEYKEAIDKYLVEFPSVLYNENDHTAQVWSIP